MSFSLDNLSAAERLAIAKDCFQFTEQRGHELHGLCPFHAEKKASFSYNVEKDLCNCLSCGASGDLVTLWGQARGYGDNKDAFIAFRDQHFPTLPTSGKQASKPKIGVVRSATRGDGGAAEVTNIIPESDYDKLAPLPEAWLQRCREQFTWTDAAIDAAGLRLCKSINGDERIAIPIRRDDGALVNIRLYKPGAVENKVTSWGKGFGKSKLTPAPSTWGKSPVIVTEGEKDRITALSHGFNACTQTAGANSWDDKFTRFFKGREVIIAYDADEKGVDGAQKVATKLLEVAKSVRILTWPDYMGMGEKHGEDLTDFFAKHHKTAQDLKDLIAATKPLKKPTSDRAEAIPEDVQRFFGGSRGTQFKPRLVSDEILSWRRLIHDPRTGQIHTWNDRHWENYDPSNIRRQILTMLDIEGSTPRCNDVLGIVRDLAVMPHGRQLNDQADMIPLENGMFSLESAQVQPHDPEHFNSYVLDITLQLGGSLPGCPTWQNFLDQSVGDPDTIRELQKFFGYCFTRETRYEKALLLIGPGGDGKGTILKVLQSLLGEINVSNVSMSGLQDQFHRVMLVDKLLNVATEIEAGLLQSDIFKTIVSGEAVTAAYKHKNAFSFAPVCKLAFSANKHPKLQDTSEGLYRRLLLIEMEKQFVKAGAADIYLLDKLMDERDGIFLWGLRGLQLLREEGFKPSDHMAGCLDRFQELNNPVLAFVRTHVDEDPDRWLCTMQAYSKYKKFCEKRGYKPLGEGNFGVDLRKVCPSAKKKRESIGKRRWGYRGIYLVDDYDGIV